MSLKQTKDLFVDSYDSYIIIKSKESVSPNYSNFVHLRFGKFTEFIDNLFNLVTMYTETMLYKTRTSNTKTATVR